MDILNLTDLFRMKPEDEMTADKLSEFITKHKRIVQGRFKPLEDMYRGNYKIFRKPKKEPWKPDHRLAAPFASYIVKTWTGFFLGHPVVIATDNAKAAEAVHLIDGYNDTGDINAELASLAAIYGRAYEIYYVDENGQIGISYLSPAESFAVYDDGIEPEMLYFCRYYKDSKNMVRGSISDSRSVRYFRLDPSLKWDDDPRPHGFDGVPATEFIMNADRQGIFEPVQSLINEYQEALSAKANDVDAFAEAYLKIVGPTLDDETVQFIRQNRIISYPLNGSTDKTADIGFLARPDADGTEEHLLDRLERLIFSLAMVTDLNSDDFRTASGVAIRYKMTAMLDLFQTAQRKFAASFNRRYRLIGSNPVSPLLPDAWIGLNYTFTPTYPANVAEEAQTAAQLSGIVSKETQLLAIPSLVKDVKAEVDKINEEQDPEAYPTAYATNRTNKDE